MSRFPFLFVAIFVILIFPAESFAWGPGVHIGVSLSVLDRLPDYLKLLLMGNVNEFLYGSLAPDFVIGKTFSNESNHSHNWKIAFAILKKTKSDKERAFAYGYLSHLAADAVVHGVLVNNMDGKFRMTKHTFIELAGDSLCSATYKQLAKQVLRRYNKDLDVNFKSLVDSTLFSFDVSKLIFKCMVRASLGRKVLRKAVLNEKLLDFLSINVERIKDYLELSRQFSLDVLIKGMDSPVVKISAISR